VPKRISVFFGAGAEISYGMPTGGQFALDIIRRNSNAERELFRGLRDRINSRSVYATDWLPKNYSQKRISSFGSSEKGGIFRSSLEYNKDKILDMLNNFDDYAEKVIAHYNIDQVELSRAFEAVTGSKIGEVIFSHDVEINSKLSSGSKRLFESIYFSAALELLRKRPAETFLEKYIRSIIQIYIGSLGQTLVAELNQEIFSRAPEDISVFDDISGLFQIEIGQAGLNAYELIIDDALEKIDLADGSPTVFAKILHGVIEKLMANCLDYQSLIDDNFRYIYRPSIEWAKFCKISVFLHSTRAYVVEKYKVAEANLPTTQGFYDDVAALHATGDIQVAGLGTSNYTEILRQVLDRHSLPIDVKHLNGRLSDYYDPYKNALVPLTDTELRDHKRFVVPFLFTQSGIKPLTSVDMSRRYVEYYDQMQASDAVAVVGFGFNGDDGHINGLFRKLIEESGKPVFITDYTRDVMGLNKTDVAKAYARKIRLENTNNIHIIPVNDDRNTDTGRKWIRDVIDNIP